MSSDSKIYVDAGQPATLNDGAGRLTDCATLQEVVLAWHALPSAQNEYRKLDSRRTGGGDVRGFTAAWSAR